MLIANPDKPFIRAGKSTIVRKMTEKQYSSEIEALYSREAVEPHKSTDQTPTLRPSFPVQSVSSFVRETVILALPSSVALSDVDDLFAYGLDSLKSIDLCKKLKHGLQGISASQDLSWITPQLIYEYPSIEKLGTILHTFVNTGCFPKERSHQNKLRRAAEIQTIVERLTSSLPSQQPSIGDRPTSNINVALTGSTGTLGTDLLYRFAKDPDVAQMFCLNRRSDAQQRQEEAVSKRFAINRQSLKVTYFTVDLGAPQLGLESQDFDILINDVHVIVHNAWKVDFNQPLSSFESQIQGVRNLINLSLKSRLKPRIMLISSVASIVNRAMTVGNGFALETVPTDDYPMDW